MDPNHASIDSLIRWLRDQRRRDPSVPLSHLLRDRSLDRQRLVDVVCIDLMQRRRMSHGVQVEDYLVEFPLLRDPANLLDLIDAEVCVATELGETVDVEKLILRFPQLAESIRRLVQIDAPAEKASRLPLSGDRHGDPSLIDLRDAPSRSTDFSIDQLPGDADTSPRVAPLTPYPVDVPQWFVGDRCVASGPGRWLIRGRDSARGIPLALKITELPVQISDAAINQILDACERSAAVANPSWVRPSVAAVQKRHLGVIRPWLFAHSWQAHHRGQHERVQACNLSQVAFAVESAHRAGATHGGIHPENLVVDHDGQVNVLDGGSSRMGLEKWLNHRGDATSPGIAPLATRKNMDVHDLIKLVAAASVDWQQRPSAELLEEMREIATAERDEACGRIGQLLMRHADSLAAQPAAPPRPSFRKRFAAWRKNEK